MPEHLAPGVFIEEIGRGPKPIEGVATSTAAFVGPTERGPTKPQLVTGYGEYLRFFGSVFGSDNYMPYAVKAFFDNGGRRCYIARITWPGAAAASVKFMSDAVAVTAVGQGAAGGRAFVRIDPSTTRGGDGNAIGFRLRVYTWGPDQAPYEEGSLDPPSEDFDDLSFDAASQSHWDKRINNGNSAFIKLDVAGSPTGPAPSEGKRLEGGNDGTAPAVGSRAAVYEGVDPDPNKVTGLSALNLDRYREVAIVHAPGVSDPAGVGAIVTHCENNRFRFAVVDSASGVARSASLDPRTDLVESQFAAFYYPWLWMSDLKSGGRTLVPPGGAVCGIYALTDNSRGVFKAPANETVAGAIDLEYDINQAAQEVLNPRGVNAIRRFPGRGIRVWGARTLSSDPLWKYVNVRRFFMFLEASIYNSTQWVVFEPNDPKLWARVKQTITLFLRTQWREGALFGTKEEEAFSVSIGRDTMTEDDIMNGRLIIEIGIAPVRPAEFVIFRIYQKTQEAKS